MSRALKDSNGKTYFDRLQEQMQKNRNNRISNPVIPTLNNYGTLNHDYVNSIIDANRFKSINNQSIPRTFY